MIFLDQVGLKTTKKVSQQHIGLNNNVKLLMVTFRFEKKRNSIQK